MKTEGKVKIVKCDVCPKVVGKVVTVVENVVDNGVNYVKVNYGKGRPSLNRPSMLPAMDVVGVSSI